MIDALLHDLKRSGIFLDFDGTLAPLGHDLDDPEISDSLQRALYDLSSLIGVVAVVSGRPASFLAKKLPVPRLHLIGVYGLEEWIDGSARSLPEAERWIAVLASAREEIRAAVRHRNDVLVRDKRVSVALHWRHAADLSDADAEFGALVAEIASKSGLRHVRSKWAEELLPPVSTGKGFVIRQLARQYGLTTLLYVGDDVGDLDAFHAVHDLGGFAIAVKHGGDLPGETPAEVLDASDLVLAGPQSVAGWIERLAALCRDRVSLG